MHKLHEWQNLHGSPLTGYRQVIDLVSLRLVFGLPFLPQAAQARIVVMSRFRRPRNLKIGMILVALFWSVACARPVDLPDGGGPIQSDQQQVPFHQAEGRQPGLGSSSATQQNDRRPETDLPFREPQSLPAGTLLTVRLKSPISADNPAADRNFEAVVDQPVVLEGNSLVPLGAVVSGRVESSQASNLKRNRGSVRLVLESIHLAGANLPLQTSSLFVRGNPGETPTPQTVIRLEKGRRLVFRLTEPLLIAATQRISAER